ncbi:MAG: phosphoribosylformylglycinamidine synthase subunit PurL [Caldilineae bacterium]|nr:MAG: phosphoribosylformylglycinamidine synthase subunit PurL [Caldilineae bacterium]
MVYRILLMPKAGADEGRSIALQRAFATLGLSHLPPVVVDDLYFLEADLPAGDIASLARTALLDPVVQTLAVEEAGTGDEAATGVIEVTYLPGVTDSVAENLLAVAHSLGYQGVRQAASGRRFRFQGEVAESHLQAIARGLLANSTVQQYAVNRPIDPPFLVPQAGNGGRPRVAIIPIRELDDRQLHALSRERRLSLDLQEMQAIQNWYRHEGRDPTDVELETLAQTWSEHCVHKTFRALIDYREEPGDVAGDQGVALEIDGLLKTFIRAATEKVDKAWVQSAFVDNAGIIRFDDSYDLAFKVETHNHPSALEPFGGANTGVGGVIRDILGVSARPIANTDVLCFGPENLPEEKLPAGVLHPRRIAEGVIHGIEDYGNKMGIPTVNGAVHYHPGYTANPLVYCGCLGILPRGSHRPLHNARAGDLIVAIGGRTGRDGLRGATFSSMEMDHTTGEIASTAVQIGNPIVEKQVMEVILRARDAGLYTAITDCGAGGFSSAIGEMGRHVGARVRLDQAPLKYPGLRPWEIWLSEAQERMILAIPPHHWPAFRQLCRDHDVEACVLGEFDGSHRLRVDYGDTTVADLDMTFLHEGVPRRRLDAVWSPTRHPEPEHLLVSPPDDPSELVLRVLAHANVRSRADIVHRYDHEVQGGTVVKPLAGAAQRGPNDAAVLIPQPCQRQSGRPQAAAALAVGINPRYGFIDPYAMAWACVDEALRNVVAVGADPDRVALLDNFCWGNPALPDRLGSLVRCARGCHDAALAYEAPFISGKDSLNNEYLGEDGAKHAIPGTLLISAVGIVPDLECTASADLKQAGDYLYLLGETHAELGGSVYYDLCGEIGASVPRPYPQALPRLRALHRAIRAGLVRACHDLSDGGLAVAVAEMCLAGELGAEIDLDLLPAGEELPAAAALFSESLGRFLIEVRPQAAGRFETLLSSQPCRRIGTVLAESHLRVLDAGRPLFSLPLCDMYRAYESS